MKDFIGTENKKPSLQSIKRLLNEVKHKLDDTEFHCSQHNNSCSKDFTCTDYVHYINANLSVTTF